MACTKFMVWGTAIMGFLLMVILISLSIVKGIYAMTAATIIFGAVPYSYFIFKNQGRISASIRILECATASLHAYPSVFGK